jgi:hypothetical protein
MYSDIEYSTDNEHIKTVSANGAIVHQYLYDVEGRIVEENCLMYFQKYLYDNDKLVKIESAFDRSGLSSSFPAERRTEFMTSKNSIADTYSLYKYDKAGKLEKTEYYFNETGKGFELRSTRTYEYEGSFIVKQSLYNHKFESAGYDVYTYDDHGNVINEKNYSNNFIPNELINEKSYKYDNYKNPYQILSIIGVPGLWTNANNIVETTVTRHYEVQGFDKYSTSNNTYEYNKNGYPVKVNESGNVFEYNY